MVFDLKACSNSGPIGQTWSANGISAKYKGGEVKICIEPEETGCQLTCRKRPAKPCLHRVRNSSGFVRSGALRILTSTTCHPRGGITRPSAVLIQFVSQRSNADTKSFGCLRPIIVAAVKRSENMVLLDFVQRGEICRSGGSCRRTCSCAAEVRGGRGRFGERLLVGVV